MTNRLLCVKQVRRFSLNQKKELLQWDSMLLKAGDWAATIPCKYCCESWTKRTEMKAPGLHRPSPTVFSSGEEERCIHCCQNEKWRPSQTLLIISIHPKVGFTFALTSASWFHNFYTSLGGEVIETFVFRLVLSSVASFLGASTVEMFPFHYINVTTRYAWI